MLAVGCGGAESRKAKYQQSGLENYSQDDCNKAKLDFRNVLQIDPKHTDAKVGLAKCFIDDQEWRNAFQLLVSANEDVNSINAKLEIAKLYLISGENEKVYQLIEEVLELDDQNSTAIALRGFFHVKNNSITAARTDANSALSQDKTNITAITLMSALDIHDDKQSQAIDRINSILPNSELSKRESRELRLILIGLYSQLDDLENIENIYHSLINDYPDRTIYSYRLAYIFADKGKIDKAENILLSLLGPDANDDQILTYISFLDKFKSKEEATVKLEEFVESRASNERLQLFLAKRYLTEDKQDQAISIFEDLADNIGGAASVESKNELAFFALKDKNIDKTIKLVEEVLSEQPTNLRALMMRGTLALSRRDAPQAITDFRSILRDEPNNELVIRQLASAYVMNGQDDLAKELVQKAVSINANSKELGLLYARLQGKNSEFSTAIDTVNELLESNKDDLETIRTLFDLQIANKDYAGAKVTAESMKLSSEDNPIGYYLSGVLLQNENNLVEAEKEYLAALEIEPRGNEPLTGLIRLYVGNKESQKAISLLQEIIQKDPDYLIPYNLLGELALSEKNYELAASSFESALKINPLWWVPYRGLSRLHAAKGDLVASMNTLKRGIDNHANIERLGVELALTQYMLGKRDEAIKSYEMVLTKAPKSLLAKNNLSMILVDDQTSPENIQQALTYLDDLKSIDDPASFDTIGWVYLKSGNITNALEFLNKAVARAPESAELRYHLGMAYLADENLQKAKEHLSLAVESEQKFDGKDIAIKKLGEL